MCFQRNVDVSDDFLFIFILVKQIRNLRLAAVSFTDNCFPKGTRKVVPSSIEYLCCII